MRSCLLPETISGGAYAHPYRWTTISMWFVHETFQPEIITQYSQAHPYRSVLKYNQAPLPITPTTPPNHSHLSPFLSNVLFFFYIYNSHSLFDGLYFKLMNRESIVEGKGSSRSKNHIFNPINGQRIWSLTIFLRKM